ncbi:hypothetical protein QC764_403480 [Podospora pseudoanserina]|uniref:C2H2-type domain-containing protein n=1 Tax=Podospora pseudoanserina TaxID=2609844 RepID=A0ABR0I9R3_9PEZI|nr:hypothetical protein QC764_403480 [Podospora pseudoanserina]
MANPHPGPVLREEEITTSKYATDPRPTVMERAFPFLNLRPSHRGRCLFPACNAKACLFGTLIRHLQQAHNIRPINQANNWRVIMRRVGLWCFCHVCSLPLKSETHCLANVHQFPCLYPGTPG